MRDWKRIGLLGLVLLFLAGCQTAPITGRSQFILLSEAQEMQMGAAAFQEVLKKSELSQDPALNTLLRRVGQRIAAVTGKANYQWEFAVIKNDKVANAFALPGGKVAIYTGILPITKDEAGLAVVLGHEIAHAIARHGGERVSQGLLLQLGESALQIALRNKDPRTLRQVSAAYGIGANVGYILPFSRGQESEADRLGLIYMAKAGYDPRLAIAFWQRMEAASDKQGKGSPPEFLSTHPGRDTRIRQIELWLPEAMQSYRPLPSP